MRRMFGGAKSKAPGPTLDEAGAKLDERAESINKKIQALDVQLRQIREQMKKARGPGQNTLKQRALRVLKQKKMYEAQLDRMMQQSSNLEQQNFAIESLKTTAVTVEAMKEGSVAMKKQFKEINIDKVEDVMDDIEELMIDHEEIQDVLARSYGVGDEIDDADLEAEFDALGEELEAEGEGEQAADYLNMMMPSATVAELPSSSQSSDATRAPPQPAMASAPATGDVDDFNLPILK